jgi:hypothetical protein
MGLSEEKMLEYRKQYEDRFLSGLLSFDAAAGGSWSLMTLLAATFTGGGFAITTRYPGCLSQPSVAFFLYVFTALLVTASAGIFTFTFWNSLALWLFYRPPTCHTCLKCRQQMLHEDKYEKAQV